MTDLVDRAALEAVIPPDALITVPESGLEGVAHRPTRDVLRDLGVPVNFWLRPASDFSKGVLTADRERLREEFADFGIDVDVDGWALLGTISHDLVYLDTRSGVVHSIPDGGVPRRLNSSLHAFVHFLYLLEVERPNYDFEYPARPSGDAPEREFRPGAEDRLRERMTAVDPVGFEPPEEDFGYEPGEPTWELVLRFVAEKLQ